MVYFRFTIISTCSVVIDKKRTSWSYSSTTCVSFGREGDKERKEREKNFPIILWLTVVQTFLFLSNKNRKEKDEWHHTQRATTTTTTTSVSTISLSSRFRCTVNPPSNINNSGKALKTRPSITLPNYSSEYVFQRNFVYHY
jgi:hypothetical protein